MSTVGVISLGCSKNRVDSERILGCFADAGFTITPLRDLLQLPAADGWLPEPALPR